MILLTIDELQDVEIKEIEEISGEKVFLLQGDEEIPYEDIEIMITYGIRETWEVLDLDRMKKLKWIQVFQTGIEQVPLKKIEKRGIKLTNVKGRIGKAIAMLLLRKVQKSLY